MAALASYLPSLLGRRKRSAEEAQTHEPRAPPLTVTDSAAVAGKCLELRTAISELKRVIAERVKSARDAAAQTAAARNEASYDAASAWKSTEASLRAKLDCDDKDVRMMAHTSLVALMHSPSEEVQAAATALLLRMLDPTAAQAAERERLMALSCDELKAEGINVNAVSAHEPEAQAWRNDAEPPLVSPRAPRTGGIQFINLRPASVDVIWVNYEGQDTVRAGEIVPTLVDGAPITWVPYDTAIPNTFRKVRVQLTRSLRAFDAPFQVTCKKADALLSPPRSSHQAHA